MQIVVRVRTLTTYVFGIVENFVAELYAGTRGIPSGFFIILVVRFNMESIVQTIDERLCSIYFSFASASRTSEFFSLFLPGEDFRP